jgi:uncharacterized spore protein YtfJ
MDQSQNLTQNVETLFSNLENFTQNEGLIGKPVTHGDKTFIPVVSMTLGYGTGNSASKVQPGAAAGSQDSSSSLGNMMGGALGLGARLSTEAVILIDDTKNDVSMMQLSSGMNANQVMSKIPQMLSGMGSKQQGQQQGQQQQGQQGQGQQ